MVDRLGHAEEHQPDAHAGREQHREPAGVGVVRHRVGAPEPHRAERRDDQHQPEQHEDVAGEQEEPVEVRRQPVAQADEEACRPFGKHQRPDHEDEDPDARDQEHGVVDVEPERSELVFDVVLTDLVLDAGIDLDIAVRHRLALLVSFARRRTPSPPDAGARHPIARAGRASGPFPV
jgi:hypothetical protein